tara:strand:- start:456 stop:1151 length:696 start_codon:yes stop_codon:yes gene_type:complete
MITFLVPTFNEKENILNFIETINKLELNYEYNILFADDDSDDGTEMELRKAKKIFGNVDYIIRKEKNRDLTQSIVLAIKKLKYKYTFILDCDLQHDYEKIGVISNQIIENNLDIVVGSRFVKEGQNILMKKRRIIESKMAIFLCKLLGIKNIKDPLSGFFIIRTELLSKNQDKIKTRGFKILLTIIYILKDNLILKETPIKFHKRKFGASKLNLKVRFLFLEQILRLKFNI